MTSADSSAQRFHQERMRCLLAARRIVIKLGTNVVSDADGDLCAERLEPLAASVARLQQSGVQVVLVSSGAVGLGRARLGLHRTRTDDLVTKQACAAVGQALLMYAYERLFVPHGVHIAQVLLTEEDFVARSRASSLRRTVEKLLKLGVVPIVNENDTVSTAELESVRPGSQGAKTRIFSDNDRLAALVASKVDANALLLLSNVSGLLRLAPGQDAARTRIPYVSEITPAIKSLATGPSQGGRGGMLTKLEAAEIATCAGAIVVIVDGTRPGILDALFAGEPVGTVFFPSSSRMAGKRRWIAFAADVRGLVVINDGAVAALTQRKASLLWSGVVRVERAFHAGDVIAIAGPDGREFARGIANRGSEELPPATAAAASASAKASVLATRDNIVLFENAHDDEAHALSR
jgi:glutamate 5-kinase